MLVSIVASATAVGPAIGAPITIITGREATYRNVAAANDVGFRSGDFIAVTAQVRTAGTTMTASQGGVALTAPCSLTGLSSSIYLCSTSIAFDPTLTGAWSLAFRNGGDSATSTTPTLAGAERPVPFVSGVTSSGSGFTPTFDFAVPPGFAPDGVRVVIFDRSVTPASALHSQGLSGTTRSFTVPATLSSGQALRANNPYSLSISLIETRDHVPFLTNPTDSGILNRSTAFFDFVTGPSAGGGVTLLPSVASVSGTVTVETPVSSQPAAAGANVASGTLIQTGSDGTITLAFPGGTQLVVSPNTQVTLLPPLLPTGDDVQQNQVRGLVTHSVANPVPFQPDHYRVQTPVATVRPTGTNFSTQYSESGGFGALVVSVQQGQTEVANRRAELATLIAGQQGSFSDAVPRVTPILPVDRGSVIAGTVNTFSWTAFVAAGGYLFEFTLNPSGFAQANPAVPEAAGNAFRLPPGAFSQANGRVELRVLVPIGMVGAGDRVQWRVFATDGTGQILPGSTASDASTLAISGARVATVTPAGGGGVVAGTNTTFAWTSFPGAAGYLFEYTLNPSGFAEANRTTPESTQSAFPVMAGAFTQSSNAVQLTIPVPLGVAPAGTSVQWRVFPVDVTRQVLPGAVASDANSFKLQ